MENPREKFANEAFSMAYMAPSFRKFTFMFKKISRSNQILISLHCHETKSNYMIQSALSELDYGERTKTVKFSVC